MDQDICQSILLEQSDLKIKCGKVFTLIKVPGGLYEVQLWPEMSQDK